MDLILDVLIVLYLVHKVLDKQLQCKDFEMVRRQLCNDF
jgi:hypothetical protein